MREEHGRGATRWKGKSKREHDRDDRVYRFGNASDLECERHVTVIVTA